ncbi:germ cell-specific gene 1 protein [Suncus etruscus]|uniref:germ cell-specific gene 1 protein n=1 Tax=Suncus etruscus TaxID=109475 RepID=UPI00210F7172|nr:germ cell-specific gene 1 protein [Suncus etruscus]
MSKTSQLLQDVYLTPKMELPKALSVRRTFLSAIFHLLSRLPTAPLLRQLWFVGTPQVPQPLCREGVAAKLDGLQMPLDCRRSSSQALVHRRENGDAWLAQRSLRNVLWLSNEKILEEPGQKCRHVNEFTPPAQRVEKGILEFTTLQGSCHPTLRLGGQRLMEKAFLPHPPSGLVANILCLSLGVIGLEFISFLLLLMNLRLTGSPGCRLQLSTLVTVSSIQSGELGLVDR